MQGRKIIFLWGNEEILGVREKGIACNGEPIDMTSDEDNGWRKLLEGEDNMAQSQIDISLSGVTKSNQLRSDWFAGTRTKEFTIRYPDGGEITGTAVLASYTETGPYNNATTFEASLQSSGTLSYTNYS